MKCGTDGLALDISGQIWKLIDIVDRRSKEVPRWKVEEGRHVVILSVSGCQVTDSGVLNSALLMRLPENSICSLAVFECVLTQNAKIFRSKEWVSKC